MAVGSCALLATAVGTFDYAGKSLAGDVQDISPEERRKRFFKQKPVATPGAALGE
jgi:hypothetical protein